MSSFERLTCPECEGVDRRDFLQALGATAGLLAMGGVPAMLSAAGKEVISEKLPMPRLVKNPAEDMVKELFAGMTAEQKKAVVRPWNNKDRQTVNPNKALERTIGDVFTKPQTEQIDRIVKAISSGPEGYEQLSRGGTWDASRSFDKCGANIFGEPGKGKFAFLFTGHHITIRCDGDSEEGAAFGGPIYYGHSPNGYSAKNIFSYQTREVVNFFKSLDGKQQEKGLIKMGNPGEGAESVKLSKGEGPGLGYAELSSDHKELVQKVMRAILSPFRFEDTEEVMRIIKKNGGMEKLHFAFYSDEYEGSKTTKEQPWSFWRLEGPGFVWNYRVLPHVHTFVNISSKLG